ncbi:MAG: phosphoribosylformylglycinamidine synthase subunit PurL [Chloroflexota bacterium]|nr:phosphoribosylformylglycinamidine synthase subunit PurL [Chloroflexota bacterium]
MTIADHPWREVALSDSEYAQIQELLGRDPAPVELGMFGAMWSEHCGYKHSRLLLNQLPTEAPWVLQGPGENAGAVDLGNGLAAVFKVESHNHPSAVEPYEGAATGVGGIVRDIFTMGARPVAILDALRFGNPDDERNRYLFDNVVAGIGGYGNCLGIPTVGGEIAFDDSYDGNPIVNAMCVGLVKTDGIVRARASGIGNVIVLIGAETGRDGLHGATFASVDDPEASHRGVVQVGNPFLEKQLMEACLELLQGDSVVAMQDLGAAGLTSSIIECASRGGVGIDIDVAAVPRRETGMTAYEVMLSESQERMVLVAAPDRFDEIAGVLDRWSLSSALIGYITDDGIVRIRDGEEVHVEVPVTHFIDECPTYVVATDEPESAADRRSLDLSRLADISQAEIGSKLLTLLGSSNLGSRQLVWEQYDHTILTNTVFGPGQADAAVLRVKGKKEGIAISMDCNSRYCELDPYLGAQYAILEATRNVSAVGARPLGMTNCLNFGNPERSPGNWQLSQAVAGLADACREMGVPIVSGNVSLYNETEGRPIQPTPMVGCVGVLDDVAAARGITWNDGDDIYLLGETAPGLGGSEYLSLVHGMVAGAPMPIDFDLERRLQQFVRALVISGMVSGVHDVADGGLAVALAEMALVSNVGAVISLGTDDRRNDVRWFGESASRALVAASPEQRSSIESVALASGVSVLRIGAAGGDTLTLGRSPGLSLQEMRDGNSRVLERAADVVTHV